MEIDEYKRYHRMEPTIEEINQIMNKMKNDKYIFTLLMSEIDNNNLLILHEMENKFYKVYDRSITIFESIQYHKKFDNTIEFFKKQKICHDEYTSMGKNLYKIYLNKEFDEMEFIKTFCHYYGMNTEEFEEIMILNLIDRSEYEESMKSNITIMYKESYNISINVHDLQYIYEVIYHIKLDLTNDKLITVVNEKKNETDMYCSKINEIYDKILHRVADDDEIIQNIKLFRSDNKNTKNKETKNTEVYLMTKLYDSLEYNEIVKEYICKTLDQIKVKRKPSHVYMLLKLVLENSDSSIKRNINKIEELVKNNTNI